MKKLFLILPVLVIMLFGCTFGGIEWGLVGTWNLTKGEGSNFDGVTDMEGTWVVNCNDTFTFDLSYKWGGNDNTAKGSGTISANYQSKVLTWNFSDFELKVNGSLYSTDSDNFDGPYSYILNCNTLIMKDDNSKYTYTKQ